MVFFLFATWWYRGSGYPVVFFWIPAKNCGNDRRWDAGMTDQGQDGRKKGGQNGRKKGGQNGGKKGGKTKKGPGPSLQSLFSLFPFSGSILASTVLRVLKVVDSYRRLTLTGQVGIFSLVPP